MIPPRLAKLRAMSLRELATRGRYAAYTTYERVRYRRGLPSGPDRLRRALVPGIAQQPGWADALVRRDRGQRFFAGVSAARATRERMLADFPLEVEKARQISDAVARHELEFFGERFSFGERIDWHADPVTGAHWPATYHRDVPTSRVYGDVKHVWELNRHQFLMDLAKRVLLDGSDRHREALQRLVLDWRRDVPYGTGPAWACALEPAFRAWSWLWAYEMLRAAGPLDPAFHLAWLTGFEEHGHFLHRHLETYTSPYNHLIGEASALFALGLLFPEFAEAPAWVARGRQVLESTLPAQFHSDGGTVEQSTFYHHATLGFYLLSGLLGRRNGCELSAPVWAAIERGIEFSMALVQPDGRVPRIGGADDGKPIRLEHLPFFDFRPYQAIGAVLFSRGDFKRVASRFWEDALWLLGAEGADLFATLETREPSRAASLPGTGYYIARTDWSPGADYVCFDCGPQAAGLRRDGVPSAAHGHADCLSIIAFLGGQPVLVDPGFYCYNGEPEWEVHFRKTAAHNTIAVDGRDQARHVHKMAWTHTYTPTFEASSLDDGIGWARGSHDGFADLGVIHRRTIWLRTGGYIVVLDELTGGPGRRATANYQFAPGMLLASDDSALFAGRFEVAWTASVAVTPRQVAADDSPASGWIIPSLGVRERAPRLLLDLVVSQPSVLLLTVLADRHRGQDPAVRRVVCGKREPAAGAGAVLEARIIGHDWEDLVVATSGAAAVIPGRMETDAPLAVVRVGRSGVEEARRIGGSYLDVLDGDHDRAPSARNTLVGPRG